MHLSPSHLATFREQGYLILPGLFSPEEVEVLRRISLAGADSEAWKRKDTAGFTTRLSVRNELGDDVFSAVARSRRVAGTMEALLEGEVYHYHHKLMIKDPEVGGAWEWHQDYGYWYENGCLLPDMGSCMVAISESTRANGCLQIVPGSHKLGRIDHSRVSDQAGADPGRVEEVLKRYSVLHAELAPGDALFFHCNMLHRSDRNASDAARLSLICCYNTRRNDPVKAHHHPNYTPLDVLDDEEVVEVGRRQLAGEELR